MVYYSQFDSPIGQVLVAGTLKGICYIALPGNTIEMVKKWCVKNLNDEDLVQSKKFMEQAVQEILDYLNGSQKPFSFPIHHVNTSFRKRTLKAVFDIPYGQTASYSEIAKKIGNPKASRAVGSANANNPLPLVIPCHRVISNDGSIGGFGGGIKMKLTLLKLENLNTNRFFKKKKKGSIQ